MPSGSCEFRPARGLFLLLLGFGAACHVPAAEQPPPMHVYWGDVHVHSNYSIDAYATGNESVTPDMAYRYARGIPITHPTLGSKVQIRRPLDFLSVTDHAVMLGMQVMLEDNDPRLLSTPWGQK